MKKSIIKTEIEGPKGELKVRYLYIPKEGLAPMLFLEAMAQYNLKFSIKEELEHLNVFKVHFNEVLPTIKKIRNYINDNS